MGVTGIPPGVTERLTGDSAHKSALCKIQKTAFKTQIHEKAVRKKVSAKRMKNQYLESTRKMKSVLRIEIAFRKINTPSRC